MMTPEPVDILGVRVHPVTQDQLIDTLNTWVAGTQPRRAYYVNAHGINLAFENPTFRESLNNADLVYCDGYGVKVAAWVLGHRIPARMTPPDWIDELLSRLNPDQPVFLLGDREDVVTRCADVMRRRHPNLSVAGHHHGYFDIHDDDVTSAVTARINGSGAHLVLVAMGMPRQEFWVDSFMSSLGANLIITVGGLFQVYSGATRRAPRFLTNRGLEWFTRLVGRPVGLFGRYVVGLPRFAVRVVRAGGGFKGRGA